MGLFNFLITRNGATESRIWQGYNFFLFLLRFSASGESCLFVFFFWVKFKIFFFFYQNP